VEGRGGEGKVEPCGAKQKRGEGPFFPCAKGGAGVMTWKKGTGIKEKEVLPPKVGKKKKKVTSNIRTRYLLYNRGEEEGGL